MGWSETVGPDATRESVASWGNERKNIFFNKKGPGTIPFLPGIGNDPLWRAYSCLLPYVQSLPPFGGDSSRECVSDHETRKRRLHDIFQHEEA